MKLSKDTITVLKNFSEIWDTLWVPEGNVLRTMHIHRGVYGLAQVPETFEQRFGIYSLKKFLGVLTLHNDVEIDFHDNHMDIRDANGSAWTKYFYADEKAVLEVPIVDFRIDPDTHVNFQMDAVDFVKVKKAASVLKNPEFTIRSRGGDIEIAASNSEHELNDEFSINVPVKTGKEFDIKMDMTNVKLLDLDYRVTISPMMRVQFEGMLNDNPVTYWVAGMSHSTHEDYEEPENG